MPIKLQTDIPEVTDITDLGQLQNFVTQIKLAIEELAKKAQSMQTEERITVPTVDDLEEGEQVRVTTGANNYIYTKKGGVIRYWQIT